MGARHCYGARSRLLRAGTLSVARRISAPSRFTQKRRSNEFPTEGSRHREAAKGDTLSTQSCNRPGQCGELDRPIGKRLATPARFVRQSSGGIRRPATRGSETTFVQQSLIAPNSWRRADARPLIILKVVFRRPLESNALSPAQSLSSSSLAFTAVSISS